MGTWKYDQPPTWRKDAIPTDAGWVHPVTGEILAACPQLLRKRRTKLDNNESNLRLENNGLFVLEMANPDGTPNYLLLE